MDSTVYLDYNATTPVAADVLEAMLPYFSERFGNASSSTHVRGWEASAAIDKARSEVAELLGADPVEIIFTSGATEAINLAIRGVAAKYKKNGRHIICGSTEHKAVLDTCNALERQGFSISHVPVNADGQPDQGKLLSMLTAETILVCLMWANNETGVVTNIPEIAREVRDRGILFLTDATQAVGKIPVDVSCVDLFALSAHKFYGPKGVGALYVRRRHPRVNILPQLVGGGQERGFRGGTLNTPGIVGLGAASTRARALLQTEFDRLSNLRDFLETVLSQELNGVWVNGDRLHRLPGTSSLRFEHARAADLITRLRSLAFSSSSACSSSSGKPSHVLTAMGLNKVEASESIRIGLGHPTTENQVQFAISEIIEAVVALRRERITT